MRTINFSQKSAERKALSHTEHHDRECCRHPMPRESTRERGRRSPTQPSSHLHRDILTRTGRAFSEGRGKPYKAIYDDIVEGFTERKYREPMQGAIRRFKAVLFEIRENHW